MYARTVTFHIKLERAEEAVNIYKNSVIPVAKMQKGFSSAYFLVNKNSGKFVSITIWDNMENAVENQKNGYFQEQVDKFEHIQVVAPEIEGFEIAAFECPNFQ